MFAGQNSNRVIPPDNALTITAAMSHGLEKLLSKRKLASLRRPKIRSPASSRGRSGAKSAATAPSSSSLPEETFSVADERSLFPQPSFIRPKNSRMVARDELCPTAKACPLPGPVAGPAKGGSGSARSSLGLSGPDSESSSSAPSLKVPYRSSSLSKGRSGLFSLASVVHYEFTDRESKNAVRSLSSMCGSQTSTSISPRSPESMRADLDAVLARQASASPARNTTPPPSDHDDSDPPSPLSNPHGAYPLARGPLEQSRSQPTPGQSPKLAPKPDSLLQTPRSSEDASERRPSLQSLLAPQTPSPEHVDFDHCAVADPILQEPNLGDFLGLSDDDIAEAHPSSPVLSPQAHRSKKSRDSLVPPPTPPSANRRHSHNPDARFHSQVQPPSPMSIRRISARLSVATSEDRASAMAAFEVARIASRYHFDLIYVINVWPRQKTQAPRFPCGADAFGDIDEASAKRLSAASSLRLSMASHDQLFGGDDEVPETPTTWSADESVGLSYRFLAAYGLHTVQAPLQIAYGVHNKILQTDGWIEYRGAGPEDYERGYACSFYTGYVPACEDGARLPSVEAQSASDSSLNKAAALSAAAKGEQPDGFESYVGDGRLRSEHNRGIVLAAYRKPRPGGAEPIAMTAAERAAMQQDAQGLVDMILDFHMVKRRLEQLRLRDLSPSNCGVFPSSVRDRACSASTNGSAA